MNIHVRIIDFYKLFKLITLIMLIIMPAYSLAAEYSIENISSLEKRLNALRSEIHMANKPVAHHENTPALYYIKQKLWEKSINAILSTTPSSKTGSSYSNILYGISLQGLKKTIKALNYYEKIPDNSRHYVTAQLNIALLYTHGGLTYKSIDIINQVLTNYSSNINNQLNNRILLILGYLYFKDKKFIKSINIFKKIKAESVYSNNALFGIALSEMERKNYTSAINTLSILNKKTNQDIQCDESHIFIAYAYEKKGNHNKAAILYNNAITHYEKRINNISQLLKQNKPLVIKGIIDNNTFIVSNNKIDLSGKMPAIFFKNYIESKNIAQTTLNLIGKNNYIYKKANNLYSDYNDIINKLLLTVLSKRKKTLLDYLKQTRYRLARSHDRLLSN